MGNNNSTRENNISQHNSDNYLDIFYGKDDHSNEYRKACDIFDNTSKYSHDVFINPDGQGLVYQKKMPHNEFLSSELKRDNIISDSLSYVEIVICKENLHDFVERHRVKHYMPGHKCNGNCNVILDPETKKYQIFGGANDSDTSTITSNESNTSATSSDTSSETLSATTSDTSITSNKSKFPIKKKEFTKKDDKKKKAEVIGDVEITDESDVDDEDLNDIDEEISEDGIRISDPHSINTSDLYKMQKKIYTSDTDTENDRMKEVSKAIDVVQRNKQIFDSEDRKILELNNVVDSPISDTSMTSESTKNNPSRIKKNIKYV
uniref:Uncharacterized protein n=1 Tax=viral metagenome TaxID=1070528 RepID=A0A6C0LVE2_9ZZZZ